MDNLLSIDYKLTGAGWSACTLEARSAHIELSASYLSDALGNMLLSATAIASGFRTTEFGFDEEPGEYRWVVETLENNVTTLRILEFQELWGYKPNDAGRQIFEASTTPVQYAKAVHACASRVLEEYGLKGYTERWTEHPFPEKQLALLGEVISSWEE